MFSVPPPGALPCHPERSGTPGLRANTTTKHCRAVEPRPPGGAPAGGISVAKRHPAIQPHPRQKNKKPPSIRTWSTRYHLILRTHEHPLRAYPLADNGGTVADYARKKSRFPRTAESDFHRRLRGTCTNRPLSARTVPLYSSLSLRLRNQYTTFSPRCQQVCGIFFKRQTDQLHALSNDGCCFCRVAVPTALPDRRHSLRRRDPWRFA